MKKLIQFKQPWHARLPSVLVSTAFVGVCLSGTVLAEDKVLEVQPGNVLGKIVSENYPGYSNYQAIMAEILKRNPNAFSQKNVNSLIVGKTLILPDAKDIPDLQPSPPPEVKEVASGSEEKPPALEADITELKDTVALLEEENAALQEMVKGYAETPAPETTGTDELKKQLDTLKQSLQDSEAAKRTLEAQVATTKRDNEALQNDLQQVRAAVVVAENNASSAGGLPWLLLSLLALLILPLIWLLRRKREPAPAPVSPVTVESTVTPTPVTQIPEASPAVATVEVGESVTEAVVDVNPDAALKLDIARAYLDLRDSAGAAVILQEVLVEGAEQQRQEAREILSFIT